MKLFQPLKHRPFALLWGGQSVSRIGDHLYQLALAWWVLEKTGSASQMGVVLICAFAPMVVFLLIGGVAVDRFSRMKVMFISDLGRGVIVGVVAVLAWLSALHVWHIYLLSVAFGLADAFFQPAYAAAVPEIVPAELLPGANSLTSLSTHGGRIIGPAIAAAVIAAGGTAFAFGLNAVSFFIAAATLLPLLNSRPVPANISNPASPQPHIFREMREGIATVISFPWLWITILIVAVCNVTLTGPYSVALPFLMKTRENGIRSLGLLYAMFPIGYALSAIFLGTLNKIRHRGPIAYLGIAMAGLTIFIFGFSLPLPILALAAILNGVALEAFGLVWTSTLQDRIPAKLLGRVSSIDSLGSYALLPVGYAIAGWATDRFGAGPIFLAGGAATTIMALVAFAHPAIQKWD